MTKKEKVNPSQNEWRDFSKVTYDPAEFVKNKVKSELLERIIQELLINVPGSSAQGNLITDLSFYGEYLLDVEFFETESLPTAAVNYSKTGMNFYYNPKFVQRLYDNHGNFKQLFYLMFHEIQHLLSNHPTRRDELNHEPELANWAMDMIINTNINECYLKRGVVEEIEILNESTGKLEKTLLLTPPEYKGEPIYEILYDWLIEERKKVHNDVNQLMSSSGSGPNKQNSNGNQNKQNSNCGKSLDEEIQEELNKRNQAYRDFVERDEKNKKLSDEMRTTRRMMAADKLQQDFNKSFDVHVKDEVDPQRREAMREQMESSMRTRGLISGEMEKMLDRLNKKKHNYFKDIKRAVKTMVGSNKTRTFSKPNRKEMEGLKGRKKYAEALNVLLDTSGSMSGDFEKVLSYITGQKVICNIVQCDTSVQDKVRVIKTQKDLSNFKIKGLGGTTLQPGLDFIKSQKNLKGLNTVILTDGYTDELDCSQIKKVLILTVDTPCPIKSNRNNVKQIVLPKGTKL